MSEKLKVGKKRNIALTIIAIMVMIAIMCTSVVYFYRYTQEMLYEESVSQLQEICSQLFEKLDIQIDNQWGYVKKFAKACEENDSVTEE